MRKTKKRRRRRRLAHHQPAYQNSPVVTYPHPARKLVYKHTVLKGQQRPDIHWDKQNTWAAAENERKELLGLLLRLLLLLLLLRSLCLGLAIDGFEGRGVRLPIHPGSGRQIELADDRLPGKTDQ
jgi:hypothetical protein